MKKLYIIILMCLLFVQSVCYAQKRTVTTFSRVPDNYYNGYNAYSDDLNNVEEYIFGRNFKNDTLISRLNRIENRLFNRVYSSMSPVNRVNNILLNYQDKYYNNYLSNTQTDTMAQRILNRFIGQPTGFTPPVMNTPYDGYGYPVGINQFNTSNRGYRYNNTMPGSMGTGVHILD